MKISLKAVLLSCFVFPGAGHWYLKRIVPGLLLSLGAAMAIYFVVSGVVNTALELAEDIQKRGLPLDVQTIAEFVSQQTSASMESTNSAMLVFLAFWLLGIIDSYRVGRALENNQGVA